MDLAALEEEKIAQLASRIKQLRIKKGYSNYESFAYEHDLPRAQYGRYEKGSNLTFKTLLKIIAIHNLTLEEFFAEGF